MPAQLQIDHAILGNHRGLPLQVSKFFIFMVGEVILSPLLNTAKAFEFFRLSGLGGLVVKW